MHSPKVLTLVVGRIHHQLRLLVQVPGRVDQVTERHAPLNVVLLASSCETLIWTCPTSCLRLKHVISGTQIRQSEIYSLELSSRAPQIQSRKRRSIYVFCLCLVVNGNRSGTNC